MSCLFCKSTPDPFVPCPESRSAHREGIVIRSGPDLKCQYVYTVFWWRGDVRRQKAQVFCAAPTLAVRNSKAWSDAWHSYREAWHKNSI